MSTDTMPPRLVAVPDSLPNVAALNELLADLEMARSRDAHDVAAEVQKPSLVAIIVLTGPASTDPQWLDRLISAVSAAPQARRPAVADRTLSAIPMPEVARRGELLMDLDSMQVSLSDRPIELTHQEFLLLRTFMHNPNRTFSRGQLLDLAWDVSDWGSGRTVDVHVRRLRVKLGPVASWIATVRGFGYRFTPGDEPFAVVGTG